MTIKFEKLFMNVSIHFPLQSRKMSYSTRYIEKIYSSYFSSMSVPCKVFLSQILILLWIEENLADILKNSFWKLEKECNAILHGIGPNHRITTNDNDFSASETYCKFEWRIKFMFLTVKLSFFLSQDLNFRRNLQAYVEIRFNGESF